ncbi:MAG TPA: hypothetical protein EYP14_13085 [Planctomycetaceae bacterium]|nr:hypothetical protein [Planctomycetaceae bacterium]
MTDRGRRPGAAATLLLADGRTVQGALRYPVRPGRPGGAWCIQPNGETAIVPAIEREDRWEEIEWGEVKWERKRRRKR